MDLNGIQLPLSVFTSHNFLGIGERYHELLRRIYRKVQFSHPTIPPRFLLLVAMKAINDTTR